MAAVPDAPATQRPCCVTSLINRLMNRATIDHEAQNRPSLIVADLAPYAPADVVYETLLRRGVFKWMAVRIFVIFLKNEWKERITQSIARQRDLRTQAHALRGMESRLMRRKRTKLLRKANEERGYRRGLEQCRAEVRGLCHGPRWQAPINDRAALRWLDLRSEVE
jgi:hypothetical protein